MTTSEHTGRPRRLVVGITGATGAIYGIRLLLALRDTPVETHLIVSDWALKTIAIETDFRPKDVFDLADRTYRPENQAAAISSGSFLTDGMIIAPCSVKTLAAIATGYTDTLIARAADVTMKEHRRLVLSVRESPLNATHLENMLRLARAGVVIAPPVPAFYARLVSLDDMINQTVGRMLDQFDIEHHLVRRWTERSANPAAADHPAAYVAADPAARRSGTEAR
jgi:4-hydroxy-3-polyprenylbenzoate decarboxylase